jgi:mono/diheme cytochrome c family protein
MSARTIARAGRAAAALALAAGALALAGCGGDDFSNADIEAGKQTFVAVCSSCHFLQDASSQPTAVGPNLDDSFRAARQVGMEEDQFAGVVKRWIKIAQLPMPRNLVTGEDADNVAAYIARVAGTQPDSAVWAAPPPTPEVPEPPRQQIED